MYLVLNEIFVSILLVYDADHVNGQSFAVIAVKYNKKNNCKIGLFCEAHGPIDSWYVWFCIQYLQY